MSLPKLRAALVVFLIGFALGVSVFAASRLVVRSVLSADAVSTAEELAARLAGGENVEATGTLSHVIRYTWLNANGDVVESRSLAVETAPQPAMSQADMTRIAELTAEAGPVVDQAPLISSLLGLSESGVHGVAAPVAAGGRDLGTVFVEVDQANALASLSQAFTVAGMMTVGLAVLAVIAIAFAVTRGRGFAPEKKVFDPSTLPRDPLTEVPTRGGFREALDHAVEQAREADKQVGLLVVDLDRFRSVNDIWGHAVGDDVLRLVAERLRVFAPGAGTLARIAGDEFALIVGDDDTHAMRQLADKIQVALGAPLKSPGAPSPSAPASARRFIR
jgi:hypothetical protein